MFTRIRYCRPNYKIRTIISAVLLFLLFLGSLIPVVGNIQEENKAREKRLAEINAPLPSITILSEEGDIGNATGYSLVYKTENATEVIVNAIDTKLFSGNNQENTIYYSLEGLGNHTLELLIIAKNEYKSSQKKLTVSRSMTDEEASIRKREIERIEAERIQVDIDRINGYIDEMKKGYVFFDIADMNITVDRFTTLWRLIEEDIDNENKKIAQKATEAKNRLITTQKTVFPLLRKKRCSISDEAMWDFDIDVECSGSTAKFIGGIYAANANIKESYTAVRDMLYQLRFKKANFYRYKGSEYSQYTIDSPSDGDLR